MEQPYRPKILYKFLPSKFVECFCSGESIRIGTLFDFRNTEKHGHDKADELEGALHVKGGSFISTEDPANRALKNFVNALGYHNISGTPWKTMFSFSVPDYYVFCATKSFSEQICARLDPEYDACVLISNVARFKDALQDGLERHFNVRRIEGGGGPVVYRDRVVDASSNDFDPNPFAKEPRYAYQDEYRFVAQPPNPNPQPFNLSMNMNGVGAEVMWRRKG